MTDYNEIVRMCREIHEVINEHSAHIDNSDVYYSIIRHWRVFRESLYRIAEGKLFK